MSTLQMDAVFEQLKADLMTKFDEKSTESLYNKFANVFSDDYFNNYSTTEIANDIVMINQLSDTNQYAISLSKGQGDRKNIWQVKLFRYNEPVSLSRGLPLIENFGVKLLDEQPRKIILGNKDAVYVCDFGVLILEQWAHKLEEPLIEANFKNAVVAAFNREVENDILNKLILTSGLNFHQVVLLRSMTHYIAQTALPFSKQYLKESLTLYPEVARDLFLMFDAKFNIASHDINKVNDFKENIIQELSKVNSIDDDQILKSYLSIIEAMLRTNYYQLDHSGLNKPYISFKLKSEHLDFLPKPKPLYEIFIYSMSFEGVHLRGGKVSRGGIRWSDRKEDFRTEVLGLVKAQIVKNSVIVPTGSKGGFICKKLPLASNRDAYLAEGVACYQSFICGLLDLTDNIVSGKIIIPHGLVRYDDDDPYLVVAADKGTATFSDYANQLSQQYGFWLGDAFASGGSAGYDHKKMGITARGAWESAKRHFRHLGINIQAEDFTVVGIGDMAGDVFGNGMLLSKHIRLVAAFNHQHIFLDPNPDAAESFAERQRLFDLPRSSWSDYDIAKISSGGGVFERSLKTIPLSIAVKALLKVDAEEMTPNNLINQLLKLNVDMLYNGGIGTYIKSSLESNDMAKDKTNDMLRVNGDEIRANVFVEGGNLGATQLGRVEFAKYGGFVCTDAIDNSAGVDCSDHEVNIKILFSDVMHRTSMSTDERNKILESMTQDVGHLVLQDNYLQTQILRYADKRAKELFTACINFMEKLEKCGELDRAIEFLPNSQEILERQRLGTGMTMPELAVILAYSKIRLNKEISASNLVEDKIFNELLVNYFPKYLQTHYRDYIDNHYLRKEIIANQIANLVVNRMGITFVSRFEDELRIGAPQIVRAFWAAYKLLGAEDMIKQVDALDNIISADVQIQMLIRIKKSLERLTRWILRNIKNQDLVSQLVVNYKDSVTNLLALIPSLLTVNCYSMVKDLEASFIHDKVPESLAALMARSSFFPQLLDVAILAQESNHDLGAVASNYFYIGRVLRIDWLRRSLIALPEHNKWQALSRSSLLADGYMLYSTFIRHAVKYASSYNDLKFASAWIKYESVKVRQINEMLDELQSYKTLDLSMLSAVVRELSIMFI
ncbi:MAG: NAD-glutamate dehydrogenase [Proteobacteria bacterium]|jgi:glutamate dehydrogenase|nr:NAD-glutamate dehydrogenase [Pseudomonadota bacterium]